MRGEAFRSWLTAQYSAAAAASRFAGARKVEASYGDLDAHYDRDGLDHLISQLTYGTAEAAAGAPNPTPFKIDGDLRTNLATLKSAIRLYQRFRTEDPASETEAAIEIAAAAIAERRDGRQFDLERDLQAALRREIDQLERGLTIVDGGGERAVDSGFIDILARDPAERLVVIELKAGQARRDALGQILGYMGDLAQEEPEREIRGILVAASFDKSCRSAVAVVPGVMLREYRFDFSFAAPE